MKKVEAFIRHEAFEPIRQELLERGIPSLSITEVKGSGRQKGVVEHYRGASLSVNVRPKLKIECVVDDSEKEMVVETILKHARTGSIGDGKIFVLPVEEAIRIRTGEEGDGRPAGPRGARGPGRLTGERLSRALRGGRARRRARPPARRAFADLARELLALLLRFGLGLLGEPGALELRFAGGALAGLLAADDRLPLQLLRLGGEPALGLGLRPLLGLVREALGELPEAGLGEVELALDLLAFLDLGGELAAAVLADPLELVLEAVLALRDPGVELAGAVLDPLLELPAAGRDLGLGLAAAQRPCAPRAPPCVASARR